ncbi:MAG TPA: pitrilysin family protein [Phycisphaerae bacterium]|nr:pitrilysin family protein [Phycisphaerae bacterium]HOQ85558.1 pitrilysin family protein [Phycisphaerae bacterium]HQE29157.1 pitrilysin family protein [Phycisphaerae bacterium]
MPNRAARARVALLVVLPLASASWAQSPANAPAPADDAPKRGQLVETKRIVDRPDERVSILDNGLTVILKAHRTAPVVCVQMYCKTGSIYEQEYLGAGMSHLFEHLLHGGATTTRSEEESRLLLDAIGGNTNAYTSNDTTCYFINTTREYAGQALNLLGDWITHPTFPQEAFDREWGVVQRELERDEDDPGRQLYYLLMETMYRDHPARYPVIGHKPIVASLKKEDIVGYYHRMYVPDNIVVTIVGDIDLDEMLDAVRTEFAGFERRKVPTIVLPEQAPMTTPRWATRRMKVQSAMMQLAWPSIRLTHPDLFALDVLSYIMTEGDSSRLARTIRDAGLTYSVSSYSYTPEWANGIFVVSARLAPDKVEQARQAILDQVAVLQQELVSDEELAKAKKQKAAEHVLQSQTAESIATMITNDYLATGDIHFSRAYVDNIQKVTAEQIREVARKYLVPERLGTIAILPEDAPPARQEQAQAAGQPEPVREVKLDNGLTCLIRRDPTTPLVAIHAYSKGGLAFESDKTNGLSRLAALLLPRGTKNRSAQEIASFFDSHGGTFNTSSGNNAIYAQAQVLKDDFAEAMDVFADVLLNPAFPEDELELFRPQLLDAIGRIGESWRTELFSYAKRRFFRNSPYRFDDLGSPTVVRQASREDVAEFYRNLVTGPNTVVAIYGDVDARLAESLVRRLFASLPKADRPVPSVESEPALNGPELYILKKDPQRKAAGVSLQFRGMQVGDKVDRAKMAVLDTIISGYRYPTGWLHESLRGGNRDLVYEVHAVNQVGLLPGMFQVYAACQPDKVNEVYRIISEQLERARAGEFTAEELERAKTIINTTELMENQTNSDRAMQAGLNQLYGLGHRFDDELLEAVAAVTLEDVKEIARKYLVNPVITVVTPAPELVDIGVKPTAIDESRDIDSTK